jgi:dihydrofolate reductase
MVKLIYSAIASLDGYIEDETGDFQWAAPDDEVHAFMNDLTRPVGTHLYGRRMYEVMSAWETADERKDLPEIERDFATVWRAADKIVYSTSLDTVVTSRTRLERAFEPTAVRRLKDSADRDLAISGPNLATHAFAAGLVDECHFVLTPVIVGAGKSAFPHEVKVSLELLDERRFGNGTVYLRYRTRNG